MLSDVIATVRTGHPHSARIDRQGPWAVPLADPDDVVGSGPRTVMLCGAYLMDRTRPHPMLSELPDVIHLPTRFGRHTSLRGAIELLAAELDQPQPGGDALLSALLDALLLYLIRAWLQDLNDHDTLTGWRGALRDNAIRSALQGMHAEPARPWTVAELGGLARLSRAAFARRFTALVGQPPLAYLTWWRMTTAAQLLRDSDATLRTVAERVGYSSEFAFSTAFKREHGQTPGAYRRDRATNLPPHQALG